MIYKTESCSLLQELKGKRVLVICIVFSSEETLDAIMVSLKYAHIAGDATIGRLGGSCKPFS